MTMSAATLSASRRGSRSAAVADQSYRQRPARPHGLVAAAQRIGVVVGDDVEVAGFHPAGDPFGVDLDAQGDPFVHGDGQRLGAAQAAEPGGDGEGPGQRSAEALAGDGPEALVGALEDSLGADVDPRPGGHLAEHGQAEMLQPAELVPVAPVGHEVGVGDEHPGRPLVGLEHADRLARLHQQRLVVRQIGQRRDHGVIGGPRTRRPAGAPYTTSSSGRSATSDRDCSAASGRRLPGASSGRSARCPWGL